MSDLGTNHVFSFIILGDRKSQGGLKFFRGTRKLRGKGVPEPPFTIRNKVNKKKQLALVLLDKFYLSHLTVSCK